MNLFFPKQSHSSKIIWTSVPQRYQNMVFKAIRCCAVFAARNARKQKLLESMSQLSMESTTHSTVPVQKAAKRHRQRQEKDVILNYTRMTLFLGLLRLNNIDAITINDGQRIMDINMYLCLLYKASKFPKYADRILETIVQSKVLLTERLSDQLIWNRNVSHRGKPETNHPNDLVSWLVWV